MNGKNKLNAIIKAILGIGAELLLVLVILACGFGLCWFLGRQW